MTESKDESSEQLPSNAKDLVKSIEAGIQKERINAVKAKLTEKFKVIAEAKRTIAQAEADVRDVLSKHEAGL